MPDGRLSRKAFLPRRFVRERKKKKGLKYQISSFWIVKEQKENFPLLFVFVFSFFLNFLSSLAPA